MSIRERVTDAEVLYAAGRFEGARVQALVAAAATSRKRYPKKTHRDSESFTQFIQDNIIALIHGTPAAVNPRIVWGDEPLDEIIYRDLRCKLVHEGEVEQGIALTPAIDGTSTFRVGDSTKPHEFPHVWVLHLLKIVREAPENSDLFPS